MGIVAKKWLVTTYKFKEIPAGSPFFCALVKEFDNLISCYDTPKISPIIFCFHNIKSVVYMQIS